MSLRFVIGDVTLDHRQTMVEHLAAAHATSPQQRFFYLVPNHVKFEAELDILDRLGTLQPPDSQHITAQSNIQVLSMTRFAWFFMKNEPYFQRPRLNKAALNMLVYSLINNHQDELILFKGEAQQTGFITQIVGQIAELKSGCVTPDDITVIANQLTIDADTKAKLHDLTIIYQAFEDAMGNQFIENSDLLRGLSDYLKTIDLSNTQFYIDGYSYFSAQEQQLVTTLMTEAAQVEIALTLDRGYPNQVPENQDLFLQTGSLYYQLYQQARIHGIKVLTDIRAKELRVSTDLKTLSDYWIQATKFEISPQLSTTPLANVQVWQADNRQVELQAVATKIRQLVQLEGYRYQDFLILSRHLDSYETMIQPIFNELEIPVFADLDVAMKDHPFVEFIAALFQVNQHYYRYSDVMRLLKTELLRPTISAEIMTADQFRDALDQTENFILKQGYEGKVWLTETPWKTGIPDQAATDEALEIIHQLVRNTIPPFFDQLTIAKTGKDAAYLLYDFLTKNHVQTILQQWQQKATAEGKLLIANQPEQIWQTFCQLLDDFVRLLGDQPFDSDNFLTLLQAGFESANFSQIPSTLDQVVISESGIIQNQSRKITFMIGSTEQVMPDQITESGLLTDVERQLVSGQLTDEQFLHNTAMTQMSTEPFLNYLGFLSSCEALYFTYPTTNTDNGMTKQSPYVAQIIKFFHLPVRHIPAIPDPKQLDILTEIGSNRSTLGKLVQVAQQVATENEPLATPWLYLYRRFDESQQYRWLTQRLLGSIDYRNVPVNLKPELVQALYGDELLTSVSRLETFFQNEYAFFLEYGLQLKERATAEITPADTGSFFHTALDRLLKALAADHTSISEVSIEELDTVLSTVMETQLAEPDFQVFGRTNRMKYLTRQLAGTLKQVTHAMQSQSQNSKMRPYRTEVQFGLRPDKEALAAIDIPLNKQKIIRLRGIIDRIDELLSEDEKTIFLSIVDYKSSAHSFIFKEAYAGTQLQMLTYLQALRNNQTEFQAAFGNRQLALGGAYYLHLTNPKLKASSLYNKGNTLIAPGDLDQAILKNFKYKGLALSNINYLNQLDRQLADSEKGTSLIYPIAKTLKDGYGGKRKNSLVTEDELNLLLAHNLDLIQQAGQRIFAGELHLNPMKTATNQSPITKSPYRSIFQFDAMLPENNYQDMPDLSKDQVINLLKEEARKHDR